ncbi:hypothetical protein HMSSN036_47310 [Paenibacillus macerans]|nr:hypothetical protein HMSSN036_47310 [Paenibacillus macerans]
MIETNNMAGAWSQAISPQNDPWDPIGSLRKYGRHVLTSVELTVTNLCNMRCEHCAVGDSLVLKEPEQLPLPLILKRLDEVEHLQTISITGGEPTFRRQTVEEKSSRCSNTPGARSALPDQLKPDLEL